MRSHYYLATVIGTYRKIIDDYYNNTLTENKTLYYDKVLGKVANREVSTHYSRSNEKVTSGIVAINAWKAHFKKFR